MTFLRPAAVVFLTRWWGVGLGLAVALTGLYWGLTAFGFVRWLGWALVPLGAIAAIAAAQKARFGAGGGGAGIVTVEEGRIAYFGPQDGGIVALDDVAHLALDRRSQPALWRIDRAGQDPLVIPVDAEGAAALFDAFVALPGLSVETLLAAQHAPAGQVHQIWRRAPSPFARIGLH